MEHNNLKGSLITAIVRAVTPSLFRVSSFRGKRWYSTQIHGIIFFLSLKPGTCLGAYWVLYTILFWKTLCYLSTAKLCCGEPIHSCLLGSLGNVCWLCLPKESLGFFSLKLGSWMQILSKFSIPYVLNVSISWCIWLLFDLMWYGFTWWEKAFSR